MFHVKRRSLCEMESLQASLWKFRGERSHVSRETSLTVHVPVVSFRASPALHPHEGALAVVEFG